MASWVAEETKIATREEVIELFEKGVVEVIEALDDLTESDLEKHLDSGQGWSLSMQSLITFPGWHSTLHAGQINYLQTCWDDQTIYV